MGQLFSGMGELTVQLQAGRQAGQEGQGHGQGGALLVGQAPCAAPMRGA